MSLSWLFLKGRRVVATSVAVMLSAVLVLSMLSVSEALEKSAEERERASSEDILLTTTYLSNGIPGGHALSEEISSDSNVTVATPISLAIASALVGGEDLPLVGVGVIPGEIEKFMGEDGVLFISGQKMEISDFFEEKGDPYFAGGYKGRWTGEILLDEVLKGKYGLRKGSRIELSGPGGRMNFTVSGFFSTTLTGGGVVSYYVKGAFMVHLSELQALSGLALSPDNGTVVDRCWGILIKVSEKLREDNEAFESFASSLKARYPLYKVITLQERFKRLDEQYNLVKVYSFSISFISASVGLLFLLAIMYINVQQKGQLLRVLKAIGASNRDIFLEVYLSSLLILFVSFLSAILVSYFVAGYINDYFVSSTGIDVSYAILNTSVALKAFLIFAGLGAVLNLCPTFKAVRIKLEGVRAPPERW
ncbi:MAG TPA: ABC transporter permease [Euryarchaeota archaeon]|nr:ABC transporter permease [Euryarchaeota archaeon]